MSGSDIIVVCRSDASSFPPNAKYLLAQGNLLVVQCVCVCVFGGKCQRHRDLPTQALPKHCQHVLLVCHCCLSPQAVCISPLLPSRSPAIYLSIRDATEAAAADRQPSIYPPSNPEIISENKCGWGEGEEEEEAINLC